MPEGLSFSDGALLEPLSVVLHAIERAPLRLGQPVLICGAGPIGLIALAAAKASGAWPLVVTDIDAARLEFAKIFVPECEVFLTPIDGTPETHAGEIVAMFTEVLNSEQPSIVYECSGVHSSVHTAAYACRRGGQVMVIGVGRAIMDGLPFMHLSLAEVCLFQFKTAIRPPSEEIRLPYGYRLTSNSLIATTTPGRMQSVCCSRDISI